MKTMYQINKVVLIVNVLLFIIPFLGLLFLMITAITQLTLFAVYLWKWKMIATSLKKFFILYGILATIALSLLYVINLSAYGKDTIFIVSMVLATICAVLSLYLSRKQWRYLQIN